VFEFPLPFEAAGGFGFGLGPAPLALGAVLGGVPVPVSSASAGGSPGRLAPLIVRSAPTGWTIPVRNMNSWVPIRISVDTII
jgi:hypothetical protein